MSGLPRLSIRWSCGGIAYWDGETMKQSTKRLIRWAIDDKMLYYPRRIFGEAVVYAVVYAIERRGGVIHYYSDAERDKVIDLINGIRKAAEILTNNNEAYQIFMAVKRTAKIEGDIAEVGVYKGGTAKLICEAKGNRVLHLFDTFVGIPTIQEIDSPLCHEGQFSASFNEVKSYLNGYKNVYFYKGIFPATAEPVRHKRFSFVNLDVDIYESTRDRLEFFYPRMNRGGVIILHDYIGALGVGKAIDEFFKDKPEPIIEMFGSQCLVVKI